MVMDCGVLEAADKEATLATLNKPGNGAAGETTIETGAFPATPPPILIVTGYVPAVVELHVTV